MGHFPSAGTDATRAIGSLLVNPVATTEVANTGALAAGAYLVGFLVSASANAEVLLNHVNAAGTGNVWSLVVYVPANGQGGPILVPSKDPVAVGESYTMTMNANLAAGSIQGGIWCVNVG